MGVDLATVLTARARTAPEAVATPAVGSREQQGPGRVAQPDVGARCASEQVERLARGRCAEGQRGGAVTVGDPVELHPAAGLGTNPTAAAWSPVTRQTLVPDPRSVASSPEGCAPPRAASSRRPSASRAKRAQPERAALLPSASPRRAC